MKKIMVILVITVLVIWQVDLSEAVTVTVDPGAGGNYTTVRAAIGDYPTWANGNNDTIELVNGVHLISESDGNDTPPPLLNGAASTLTIKPAMGASPVLAMDPFDPPRRMFLVRRTGTYIFEGLTLIGADDVVQDDTVGNNRACFQADGDDPGQDVRMIIRDCVVTRNLGGNVPDFDYTHAIPEAGVTPGTFRRALYVGDERADGDLTVLVENSVFAYSNDGTAAFYVERDPVGKRDFTFRHVLACTNRPRFLRSVRGDINTTFLFEECCFANCPNETLLFTDNTFGSKVTVLDCLFSPSPGRSDNQIRVSDSQAYLDLTVRRTTFFTNNNDAIRFSAKGGQPGLDNIIIEDVIERRGDSLFNYEPNFSGDLNAGSYPASLTVGIGISTVRAVREDRMHPSIQTAFISLYSGAGPITADPLFLNTDFDSTVFANIRKWDSTTNNFLDIGNVEDFRGKGSAGSDLTGGAECPGCVSVVDDWTHY